jgi:hypothetical protein
LRIERVADFALHGGDFRDLRTHLDEWAALKRGGLLLTVNGNQVWFNRPCPIEHGARLLDHMDRFTPAAYDICVRGRAGEEEVRKARGSGSERYRLMVEHAVPMASLGLLLRKAEKYRTSSAITAFLNRNYRRCVMTKAESDRLDRLGADGTAALRKAMPTGWRDGDDPYARYAAIGLETISRIQ